MKKRLLSMLLASSLAAAMLTTPALAAGTAYSDTENHWAKSSIERWSDYGIVQGSGGAFQPDSQLTCAQLATILTNLLKLPAASDAGFSDNQPDAWYFDAINRCKAAGILTGNTDGTVSPNAPISRERAMVMLGRALGIEPISSPDLTKYTDAAKVAPYAQGYVAAMIREGIVGGVTSDQLAPQSNINRASTVTILDRAISTYADKAGSTVTANGGLALVVADDVTLTGQTDKLLVPTDDVNVTVSTSKTTSSITITGDDSTVTVKNSGVNSAAVHGDNSKVILNSSTAGDVTLSGANSKVETTGSAKVDSVTVTEDAKGATVAVGSGTTVKAVDNKAADTTVTGSGTVSKVASDTNVTVETKNTSVANTGSDNITVTDKNGKSNSVSNGSSSGSTTTVNKETTGGGSSGGGSSSHSHSYASEWTFNDETHWHASTCGHDSKSGEAKHTYDENGVCTVCGQLNPANAVAQIGSQNYKTLADAINAAADGQTVTVVKDISLDSRIFISKKVTVDLNGKTVTRDMSAVSENFTRNEGNLFTIQSNGELTLKDSTGNGMLTAKAPADNHYSTDTLVLNYGKFTLESGTIKVPEMVYYAVGCYGKDSVTTINGGVIDAQWGDASDGGIALGSNGTKGDSYYDFTLNINGGEIKGGEQTLYLPGAGKTTITGGKLTGSARGIEIRAGELSITGGEISANAIRKTDAAANNGASGSYTGALVAVKPAGVSASGYVGDIVLNISGGTFTNTSGDVLTVVHENPTKADAPAQNVTVSVSGGQFTGAFNVGSTVNTAVNDKLGLTGGTYSTDPSAYVAAGYTAGENTGVWTIEHAHDGSETYPYTLAEFNALTRENTQNKTTIVTLGTQDVTDISYSEQSTGYTGKGVMLGNTSLNHYNAEVPAVGPHKFVFKDGTVNGTVTGYSSIDGATTNSMYMLLPGNSDVTFENVDFTNVVSFDIQKYTAGWSHLNSITFKNCTFDGIIVGTCPASNVTFDGCTFNSYTNTTDANNSNPIWWRAEGEGQGSNATYIKNFTFTNNKVTGTRPVKIERIGRDGCNPVFTFKNNQFDITLQGNEDGQAKNMAINIGQYDTQSKFTLIDDGNTISANTAALYTASIGSGSNQYIAVPGCKVLDGSGNEKVITAMVWKTKTGETFELKTISESSES